MCVVLCCVVLCCVVCCGGGCRGAVGFCGLLWALRCVAVSLCGCVVVWSLCGRCGAVVWSLWRRCGGCGANGGYDENVFP